MSPPKKKLVRKNSRSHFRRRRSITPDYKELSFFTNPLQVLVYSGLYVVENGKWAARYVLSRPNALLYGVSGLVLYTSLHLVNGSHVEYILSLDALLVWYAYWVFLGILSSIGLGAGLHTFVLFLGPHIARVTMSAYKCGSLDFAVYGPKAFKCPAGHRGHVTFVGILMKVLSESILWGAGTAVGELPPYFMARAAAAAGKKIPEIEELSARSEQSESLKDRILANLKVLLEKYGFLGIFLFASIPNPLFDLAGITCGHFQVPFWTFFGATLLGKSCVKATIQSIVVVTAFSKETIDTLLAYLKVCSIWLHDLAQNILVRQASLIGDESPGSEPQSTSLIGLTWNGMVTMMLIYFGITMLESFASSYYTDISNNDNKADRALKDLGYRRQRIA